MGKLPVCTQCATATQKGIAAAKLGHLDCLRAVYSGSGVLNERDQYGATPIHYAARQGHLACLKWLCESSGISPNAAARNGATPAHDAAATGHVECVAYLLKETKCSANDKTSEGATVLQLTCRFGKAKVLKWLLAEGVASLTDKGANDVTAIHIAAAKDNLSCLKVMTRNVEYSANEVTKSGATPVYFAAQEGSLRCLRWLIERCNGDALQRASDGMAPVHAAAGSGHLLCMAYLIESAGISSRMRSAEGATPVHYAAAAGKVECLQWLLDKIKGKKLDKDLSGGTAIHDAAELGQADAIRVFLRRGYKIDERDDEGVTAVDLAKENSHKECIDLLQGLGDIGNDAKVDLSNPGAAIRKASAAAMVANKRQSVVSIGSDDGQAEAESANRPAVSPSSAFAGQDAVDGGTPSKGEQPAMGKKRPLPPPPPPAAAAAAAASEASEAATASPKAADESDEIGVLSDSAGVLSETDDDLDDSNTRQRRKSIATFFTNMKKRMSSSSLVEPAPSKASEPAVDDGEAAAKKRRRFKLPKLKKLWRSQTSLDQPTSPPVSPSNGLGSVPEDGASEIEPAVMSDTELEKLAAAGGQDTATPDVPRRKAPVISDEEKAERKRKELEDRLADEERLRRELDQVKVRPEAEEDDEVWEPLPADLLANLRKKNEEEARAVSAVPEYMEEEEEDPLLAAMEAALENKPTETFAKADDHDEELQLNEAISESADAAESETNEVDPAPLVKEPSIAPDENIDDVVASESNDDVVEAERSEAPATDMPLDIVDSSEPDGAVDSAHAAAPDVAEDTTAKELQMENADEDPPTPTPASMAEATQPADEAQDHDDGAEEEAVEADSSLPLEAAAIADAEATSAMDDVPLVEDTDQSPDSAEDLPAAEAASEEHEASTEPAEEADVAPAGDGAVERVENSDEVQLVEIAFTDDEPFDSASEADQPTPQHSDTEPTPQHSDTALVEADQPEAATAEADEPAGAAALEADEPAEAATSEADEPAGAAITVADEPAEAVTSEDDEPAEAASSEADEPAEAATTEADEPAEAAATEADEPAEAATSEGVDNDADHQQQQLDDEETTTDAVPTQPEPESAPAQSDGSHVVTEAKEDVEEASTVATPTPQDVPDATQLSSGDAEPAAMSAAADDTFEREVSQTSDTTDEPSAAPAPSRRGRGRRSKAKKIDDPFGGSYLESMSDVLIEESSAQKMAEDSNSVSAPLEPPISEQVGEPVLEATQQEAVEDAEEVATVVEAAVEELQQLKGTCATDEADGGEAAVSVADGGEAAVSVADGGEAADSVTDGGEVAASVADGGEAADSVADGAEAADSVADGGEAADSVTDVGEAADSVADVGEAADSVVPLPPAESATADADAEPAESAESAESAGAVATDGEQAQEHTSQQDVAAAEPSDVDDTADQCDTGEAAATVESDPAQEADEPQSESMMDTADVDVESLSSTAPATSDVVATDLPDGGAASVPVMLGDDDEPVECIEMTEIGPPAELMHEPEPSEPTDTESDLARALAKDYKPDSMDIEGDTSFVVLPELTLPPEAIAIEATSTEQEPVELAVASPHAETPASESEVPIVTGVVTCESGMPDDSAEQAQERAAEDDNQITEITSGDNESMEEVQPSSIEAAGDVMQAEKADSICSALDEEDPAAAATAAAVVAGAEEDVSLSDAPEASSPPDLAADSPLADVDEEQTAVLIPAPSVAHAPQEQGGDEPVGVDPVADVESEAESMEAESMIIHDVPAAPLNVAIATKMPPPPVPAPAVLEEESESESVVVLDDVTEPAATLITATNATATARTETAPSRPTIPKSLSLEEMLHKSSKEEQVFAATTSEATESSKRRSSVATPEDLDNIKALVEQEQLATREQMAMLQAAEDGDEPVTETEQPVIEQPVIETEQPVDQAEEEEDEHIEEQDVEAAPMEEESTATATATAAEVSPPVLTEKQKLEAEARRVLEEHKKKRSDAKLSKKELKERERQEKKDKELAKKEARAKDKAAKGKKGIMSGLFGRGKRKSSSGSDPLVIQNENAIDGKKKQASDAAATSEAAATPPPPEAAAEAAEQATPQVSFAVEEQEVSDLEEDELPPPPMARSRRDTDQDEDDNDGDIEDEGEQEDDFLGALPASAGLGKKSSKRDRFMSADEKYMEKVQEAVQLRLGRVEAIASALTAAPVRKQDDVRDVFRNAGQESDLEMWRVKGKEVIKVTESLHRLTPVDAALYLRTKPTVGAKYFIHLWTGLGTPESVIPSLVNLAHELDASLPGLAVIHKETQFHESPVFLSYFKKGLRIQRAVAAKDKRRLLHIQGIQHIAVNEVEVTYKSLNKGDVFILETKKKVFVWLGSASIDKQKLTALRLADEIAEERGGLPVRTVREDSDNAAFWLGIGSRGAIRPAMGKGIHKVDRKKQKVRLYRLVGSGDKGKLKVTEDKARPLHRGMLASDSCVILDTDFGIFVWVGSGVGHREARNSFKRAAIFIHMKGYPAWAPVIRIREHGEIAQFKQHFQNWPEVDLSMVASKAGLPAEIVAEASSMIDRGVGQVKTWTLENNKRVQASLDQYGKLRSSDSYIIHYTYRSETAASRHALYIWHGADSSKEKHNVATANAEQMASGCMKDGLVMVRLSQGSETDHFLSIFKGQLAIFMAPAAKRRGSSSAAAAVGESRLFLVKGKLPLRISTQQVPCRVSSLNSNHAFLLVTAKQTTFAWAGKGSSQAARRAAVGIARVVGQKGKEPQRIIEGEETQLFWHAVGGRSSYNTAVQLEAACPPPSRLFMCCIMGGRLTTEELFHFGQADLFEQDIMLLDTSVQIFLWVGIKTEVKHASAVFKIGTDFLDTDQQGRSPETTPINIVYQAQEPVTFTSHFAGWSPHYWDGEPQTVESVEAHVTGKRDSFVSMDGTVLSLDSSGAQTTSTSPEPPLETQLEETPSAVNLAQEDFIPSATAATEVIERRPSVDSTLDIGAALDSSMTPSSTTHDAVFEFEEVVSASAASEPPADEKPVKTEPVAEEAKVVAANPNADHCRDVSPGPEPSTVAESSSAAAPAADDVTDGPALAPETVKQDISSHMTSDETPVPYNVLQQHLDSNKSSGSSLVAATTTPDGLTATSEAPDQEQAVPAAASSTQVTETLEAISARPATVEQPPKSEDSSQPGLAVERADGPAGDTSVAKTPQDEPSDDTAALDAAVPLPAQQVSTPQKPAAGSEAHRRSIGEDSFPMPDLSTLDHLASPAGQQAQSMPVATERRNSSIQELLDSSGMMGTDLDSIIDCLTMSSINLLDGDKKAEGEDDTDNLEKMVTELDGMLESSGLAPLEVRLSGRRNVRLTRSPSDVAAPPSRLLDVAGDEPAVRRTSSSSGDPKKKKRRLSKQRTVEVEGPETVKIPIYRDNVEIPFDIAVQPSTTAQHVVFKMVERTRAKLQMTLCLVEVIEELHVERRLEDHELVLDVRGNWPAECTNKLVFKNSQTKYALWERPQLPHAVLDAICDDNEVPVIEGVLQEKPPLKKSWRKRFFQLEHLGLLANCSGDDKSLQKKESMEMIAMFADHNIYTAFGNDKLNVGPTQFCIFLKPHKTNDRNDVKTICASNAEEFVRWIAAMRMMKYGGQLRSNYQAVRNQFIAMAKMKQQLSRQGLYGVKPARH